MPMSPFVAGLRSQIGHELLFLPTVAVRCRDEEGRVLMVRLLDNGKWSLPGGSMEPFEDPEESARREAREETGVEVELGAILKVFGGPRCRTVYPNGDELAYVALLYDARPSSGAARPDGEETSEVAWCTPAELAALQLDNFASMVREASLFG